MEEQKKEMIGIMNFGKYKGKKIKDIIELDKPYVMCLQKNQKYLNDKNKQTANDLLTV